MKKYLFNSDLSDDQEHYVAYRLRTKFEMVPMIRVEFRSSQEWLAEVPEEPWFWAFTSKNGIRAVKPEFFRLPETEGVFCVGPKTAELLADRACEVSFPQTFNSDHLLRHIIESGADRVIHFRGNRSGDDLVTALRNEGIEAKGIEVYQTLKVPEVVDMNTIKGLVFMSPSAIEVFSEANDPHDDIPVFCIGPTTAASAQEHGFTQIHVPEEASMEALVEMIRQYEEA